MSRVESGETCFPEGWGDDDAIFVDSDAVSSIQVLAYVEVFPNGRGCLKSSVRPSFLECQAILPRLCRGVWTWSRPRRWRSGPLPRR